MKNSFYLLTLLFLFTTKFLYPQTSSPSSDSSRKEGGSLQEIMPQFPGGDKALMDYLNFNLHYPAEARGQNIKGIVKATFIIDSTGTVRDAKILEGKGKALNDEALKLINAMPKWTPGMQNGKPVNVQFNLPINFNIDGLNKRGGVSFIAENGDPHFAMGNSFLNEKQYSYAIAQFTMCILANDSMIDAYYNRAAAYFKSGEKEAACRDWQRCHDLGDLESVRLIEKHCQSTSLNISQKDSATDDADKIFTIVEEMPHFPEGDAALKVFLKKNVIYPLEAKKKYLEGIVYVTFVVNKMGKIIYPRILRSLSPETDQEALRVINIMPDWIPGRQNGLPLNVQYNMPINFRMN